MFFFDALILKARSGVAEDEDEEEEDDNDESELLSKPLRFVSENFVLDLERQTHMHSRKTAS